MLLPALLHALFLPMLLQVAAAVSPPSHSKLFVSGCRQLVQNYQFSFPQIELSCAYIVVCCDVSRL